MPQTVKVAQAKKTWFCPKCETTLTQPAFVTWVAHKCNPMGNTTPLKQIAS